MNGFGVTVRMALGAAALVAASQAGAMSYQLDSFEDTRDGAAFFFDGFDDGFAPPVGTSFIGSTTPGYLPARVVGDFSGAESGGKLTLDPTQRGVGTVNPVTGIPEGIRFQAAYLNVNTQSTPEAAQRGLKINHTFKVSGLFDFATPGPVRGLDSYGIRLADFGTESAGLSNDILDLQVYQSVSTGRPRLEFIRRSLGTGSFLSLASTLLDPTGGDQLMLTLSKPTAFDPTIVASFQYYAGGAAVGAETAFAVTAAAFNGENFTRPGFIAVAPAAVALPPVPEPQTWGLMLAGLGALIARARSRRRHG